MGDWMHSAVIYFVRAEPLIHLQPRTHRRTYEGETETERRGTGAGREPPEKTKGDFTNCTLSCG